MKKVVGMFWTVCFFLLSPAAVFAADTKDGGDPLGKMEQYMGFDWSVIDDLSWGFKIYSMIMSIFIIFLFVWLVVTIPVHIFKSLRAKAKLGDKGFWLQTAGIFILLVLFMTTAYFSILKSLYNFTEKQDIGESKGDTAAILVLPDASSPWNVSREHV